LGNFGLHIIPTPSKAKNSKSPSHGTHAGIAGSTDTVRAAWATWLPLMANTYAVTVWGAAAGVTSTVRVVPITPCPELEQSGVIEVLNPDVGKPSTPKQTCAPATVSGLRTVTVIFPFSPTFSVIDEG
jgi:hypothetical protein